MAGIGFSLRKLLGHASLSRTLAAYSVAGIINGGPWLIAIIGILILSLLIAVIPEYRASITEFQISFTYLVACSLILSGLAGNSFSRYAADQLFLNKPTYVISNLNGLMLILTTLSGIIAFIIILFLFPQQDIFFCFCFMGNFVLLTNIWVVISLLTGLKDYKIILIAFLISYPIIVILAYSFRQYELHAFILSFLLGHFVLIFILLVAIYKEYPTNIIVSFHFLRKNNIYKVIVFSGFFFNLAVWIDKFVFWYSPSTGNKVFGPLQASLVYDLPIFIAYLCLLPGTAVFLLLMETNFADYYDRFNEAVRRGKSLAYIRTAGDQMVSYAYNVIYSIAKIQAITVIFIFQFGERLLKTLGLSILYKNLLYVAVIGTSLQVILLAIINILYYMDRRRNVFLLSFLFCVLNFVFTSYTIYLGPFFYGFGFTCALIVVCTYGMYMLKEEFTDLDYKVIMLQERSIYG